MSVTSWIQVQSDTEHFRWDLGLLATSGEKLSITTKNEELGFWVPFICWRILERVGFRERGMRLSGGSSRSELKILDTTYSKGIPVKTMSRYVSESSRHFCNE